MEKTIGRTFFHNTLGSVQLTITLMAGFWASTYSAASQTTSSSDSTTVMASEWAFNVTDAEPRTVVTRHFVSPSAFQLEQGEGLVQSNLILNVASVGLSEHLSASCILGGPVILGAGMAIKTGHQIGNKARWSLGGLVATEPAGGLVNMPRKPVAMGFTTFTLGNPDKNVSISVGLTNRAFTRGGSTFYVYSGEEQDAAQAFIEAGQSTATTSYVYPRTRYHRESRSFLTLSLCGMWPLASRLILISENHLFSDKYFSELEKETYNGSGPSQGFRVPVHYYLSHIHEGGPAWSGSGITKETVFSLGFRTWSVRRALTLDAGLIVAPTSDLVLAPWFSISRNFITKRHIE